MLGEPYFKLIFSFNTVYMSYVTTLEAYSGSAWLGIRFILEVEDQLKIS